MDGCDDFMHLEIVPYVLIGHHEVHSCLTSVMPNFL